MLKFVSGAVVLCLRVDLRGIDTDVSYSGAPLDLDSVAVDNSNDPYLTFGVDDADFSVGGTAREKSSNQYQQKYQRSLHSS
jgi:hypothetical protein